GGVRPRRDAGGAAGRLRPRALPHLRRLVRGAPARERLHPVAARGLRVPRRHPARSPPTARRRIAPRALPGPTRTRPAPCLLVGAVGRRVRRGHRLPDHARRARGRGTPPLGLPGTGGGWARAGDHRGHAEQCRGLRGDPPHDPGDRRRRPTL
ncbi:MAG: hypothetical protein AVDCRST_MAG38-909, partial [uncultured Solirubrobacteraceae bacterium]